MEIPSACRWDKKSLSSLTFSEPFSRHGCSSVPCVDHGCSRVLCLNQGRYSVLCMNHGVVFSGTYEWPKISALHRRHIKALAVGF